MNTVLANIIDKIDNIEHSDKPIYLDGLPFVFSAWLSPSRKEIYHNEIIILSSSFDAGDTNNDFFNEFYPTGIFDLFSGETGLWYVTGKVHSDFTEDYYGEVDHEFVIDEIYNKCKCNSFTHLREITSQCIKNT